MNAWMHKRCQNHGCQRMDGGCHEEHGGRCQLSNEETEIPIRKDSATHAKNGCGSETGTGTPNTAKVESLLDHMAYLCECGSARFALLRSGGIECHGCGKRQPFEWEEYDASQCDECGGTGRVATSGYVDNSGYPVHGFDDCDKCEGIGWVGPDAEKRASFECGRQPAAAVPDGWVQLQRLFTSYGNAMYRDDPDAAELIAKRFSDALLAAAPQAPQQAAHEADPLTQAIQRLNSTPYALTKDECIQVLRELRAELSTPPATPVA